MACNPSDLSALCYASGFTLWHYKTPNHPDDISDAGYFNEVSSMLRVGDFMFINANVCRIHEYQGRRAIETCALTVVNNSAGIVEVDDPHRVGG